MRLRNVYWRVCIPLNENYAKKVILDVRQRRLQLFIFKVNEGGAALSGALFALYISEGFSVAAERIVYIDHDGVVAFENLPAGIFYVQEAINPSGYILESTVYKVVLGSTGFEIYYGENFEKKLSDNENKVVNRRDVQPVSVTLTGTKNLIGRTLLSGMFNFVVKDDSGVATATGTNDTNGNIHFGSIKFEMPGAYVFTVEEVRGGFSGITYDESKFAVTVTVTDDGRGKLAAEVSYPVGGIIFNNRYATTPVRPCQCYARSTKCRKSMEGKKIWVDNDNEGDRRPPYVEIILLRDSEVYRSILVDSAGDGTFIFCCVPIWKNSGHKYNYQIDEATVPDSYTKKIEGYNVINTLIP